MPFPCLPPAFWFCMLLHAVSTHHVHHALFSPAVNNTTPPPLPALPTTNFLLPTVLSTTLHVSTGFVLPRFLLCRFYTFYYLPARCLHCVCTATYHYLVWFLFFYSLLLFGFSSYQFFWFRFRSAIPNFAVLYNSCHPYHGSTYRSYFNRHFCVTADTC